MPTPRKEAQTPNARQDLRKWTVILICVVVFGILSKCNM
jgi:hypothetical protein